MSCSSIHCRPQRQRRPTVRIWTKANNNIQQHDAAYTVRFPTRPIDQYHYTRLIMHKITWLARSLHTARTIILTMKIEVCGISNMRELEIRGSDIFICNMHCQQFVCSQTNHQINTMLSFNNSQPLWHNTSYTVTIFIYYQHQHSASSDRATPSSQRVVR